MTKLCPSTPDLFAAPAPTVKHARRKRVVKHTGTDRGHAMAELAASRGGEAWKQAALAVFMAHAETHKRFLTEAVRAANPILDAQVDPRAWGAVALKASRLGYVKSGGWQKADDPIQHGKVVTLWIFVEPSCR